MTGESDHADRAPRSDEELVRTAVAHGQSPVGQAAATELFGRYQRRVYLWCFRMVREHEQALDLAQDAQLSAYRALGRFQGNSRFSSWLFAIVRNKCLDALRPVRLLRDEAIQIERLVDPGKSAAQALQEREDHDLLLERMRDVLSPIEQKALALRCFERVPVEEITRLLALENATGARGLLQRARRKLRAELARSPGDDLEGEGRELP